jgi:hypothetical protein
MPTWSIWSLRMRPNARTNAICLPSGEIAG